MDYIEERVNNLIKGFKTAPYLFVGSGFARRYLNLEDWEGLLRKFCLEIKPYEFYRSSCDGDFTKIANKMGIDYNEMIWASSKIQHVDFINRNKDDLKVSSSALKIAISEYLNEFGLKDINKDYFNEIELIKKVNIEGIITTNWDKLLKELFPDFEEIVGQDELIYSNPFGIGEIFKIHGCLSDPNSLVLTEIDYDEFNSRNAYLAAKLVTYFVEHPVIFIGYSLSDKNIIEILNSLVKCLGETHTNKLTNNFIFVQRSLDNEEITQSIKDIGGSQIPITIIKLRDFSKVFKPLTEIKRRLPVRLLRYFKQQLFEFVQSNDPNSKVAVIDIEDNTANTEIEFAIGIGLHDRLGKTGYDRIKIGDLIEDILFGTFAYNALSMVEKCIPEIQGNVPIFKYYNQLVDYSYAALKKNALKSYKKQDLEAFQSSQYKNQFYRDWSKKDISALYNFNDFDKAIRLIPFYQFKSEEEVDELGDYLRDLHKHYFQKGEPVENLGNSFYRKIVCLYDLLKYNMEW